MRRLHLLRRLPLLPAIPHYKSLHRQIAHNLFDEFPHRPPTPFHPQTTPFHPLEFVRDRLSSQCTLTPTTVAVALKSCRGKSGTQLHAFAVASGLDSYLSVSNSLMNMYSKSGSFDLACKIFATIPSPDVVSWNTILCGLSCGTDALEFTRLMRRAGVSLDAVTFTAALAFSADLRDLEFGLQLHSLVFRSGFYSDTFVGNALVTAYSRGDCLEEARKVFDEMPLRDLVSWNALISGITQEGNSGSEAIQLFLLAVKEEELKPDHVLYASVISICVHEGGLEFGCQVHGSTVKVGLETHVAVSNVLMSMYYKHGYVDCARRVFDNIRERNVISWTTLISMGSGNAVHLFNSMRSDDVQPNDVTFIALIYAISAEHSKVEGEMVHGICFKTSMSRELYISNSLITMYAKFESMEESRKVFEEMNYKEIVSWNALISGYAQNDQYEEALEIFSSSILHCKPNQYTFGSVLSAITAVETISLNYGRKCHGLIIKLGLDIGEYISGALIDMYAKRGSIDEAQKVFDGTVDKSLISWTAIISAHAKNGSYAVVMRLLDDMISSGVRPDQITFLAVLTACGGKGMVDMGCEIFKLMVSEYCLEPWSEHYACMVDMLGRAGRLTEAEEFIEKIPLGPGISALQSLLGACRVHGNVEMGERAAKALMEMEPMESGSYVLISNMYAEKEDWKNVAKVRKRMRDKGVKKEVGLSWADIGIEDSVHMHEFSSDDNTHPLAEDIYMMAECLGFDMKNMGEDLRTAILAAA